MMRLGKAAEKIFLFFIISILAYHIISCLWILVAQMSDDYYGMTWIIAKDVSDLPHG